MDNVFWKDVDGTVTVTVDAIGEHYTRVRFAFDCLINKEVSSAQKEKYVYDTAHAMTMLAGYNFAKIVDVKKAK